MSVKKKPFQAQYIVLYKKLKSPSLEIWEQGTKVI